MSEIQVTLVNVSRFVNCLSSDGARFHDDKLTPLRSRLIKMRIFFRDRSREESKIVCID